MQSNCPLALARIRGQARATASSAMSRSASAMAWVRHVRTTEHKAGLVSIFICNRYLM